MEKKKKITCCFSTKERPTASSSHIGDSKVLLDVSSAAPRLTHGLALRAALLPQPALYEFP